MMNVSIRLKSANNASLYIHHAHHKHDILHAYEINLVHIYLDYQYTYMNDLETYPNKISIAVIKQLLTVVLESISVHNHYKYNL